MLWSEGSIEKKDNAGTETEMAPTIDHIKVTSDISSLAVALFVWRCSSAEKNFYRQVLRPLSV